MPIIGIGLNSVEAKKNEVPKDTEIKVNSTPKITGIKEMAVPALKQKALDITFEFATTYEPGLGEIKLGGNVIFTAKDNKKVLEHWKKKKSLTEDASVEVLNYLFRICLLKISHMAEDLQLPVPLQFPKVKPKQ